MSRGGRRPGAGRPRIRDADRLEIGRQAAEIMARLEFLRLNDRDDVGSASRRKMRSYDREIQRLRNEEEQFRKIVRKNYPEEERLNRMLKYRREISNGEHKGDVEDALKRDQGTSDSDTPPSRFLHVPLTLPRRYGKRKIFLEQAAKDLDDTGQFHFEIGPRLVADCLRLFRASQPPQMRVVVATAQSAAWSEPAVPIADSDDAKMEDPGYRQAVSD